MSNRTLNTHRLQTEIERRLGDLDPSLELIALEQPGGEVLRLYIDHADGVGLDRCERVTGHLRDLLADYALEVSSPGLDRPLTKQAHYERFLGHRVRVRTAEPIGGQRNFTGRLDAAGPDSITVEAGEAPVEIPLDRIHRSNLVPELSEVQ
jgi:ribosome maturation factor RimP